VHRLKIRPKWANLSRKYETNRTSVDDLKKRNDNDESLSKTPLIFSNKCIKIIVINYHLQCDVQYWVPLAAEQFQKWGRMLTRSFLSRPTLLFQQRSVLRPRCGVFPSLYIRFFSLIRQKGSTILSQTNPETSAVVGSITWGSRVQTDPSLNGVSAGLHSGKSL